MVKKTKQTRVPAPIYDQTKVISDRLGVSLTKGFTIRENLLLGNFTATKKKKKRGGTVFEIKFKDFK